MPAPASHSAVMSEPLQSLEIKREEHIAAPIEIVFETVLEHLGPHMETGPRSPLPMTLEACPGGRWFRDLGNSAGHLWGHVQVIKPPVLLEICGPFCMSYPAMNHLQYRLTEVGNETHLALHHRAVGHIIAEHRDGMPQGWAHDMAMIRVAAERRAGQALTKGTTATAHRANSAKELDRAFHAGRGQHIAALSTTRPHDLGRSPRGALGRSSV